MPEAVFFDLDGTLADTAPDLGAALNRLLVEQGRAPLAHAVLRPHVSAGARGLLHVGFGIGPENPAYTALRERFLDIYEQSLCKHTALFDGMDTLLAALEAQGIAWGVVTNKPERFTRPLLAHLGVLDHFGAVVGGDTLAQKKPDPAPLLHALRALGTGTASATMVGDGVQDLQAGKAAGVRTIACLYGYGDPAALRALGADDYWRRFGGD